MKIAVTDACIFIDLYELQLTSQFFTLDIEVHTSYDVVQELYEQQQQLFGAFQSVGKLTVHIISESQKKEIISSCFPKSLSDSDKTVLYLATTLNAMIISSDKTVRNTAKNNAIGCHGMIWIFDELVRLKLIEPPDAIQKLKQLINRNVVFQNNKELVLEMNKRLALWSK